MKNSKFYTLLSKLEKGQVENFHKYLKQVHAKKKIPFRLFEYILKQHSKTGDPKRLELKFAHRKMNGTDAGYKRKDMLNSLADLHGWLKEFLLIEKAKSRSTASRLLWLSVLKDLGMDAEFSKQARLLQMDREAQPKKSLPDYLESMVLQQLSFYHLDPTSADFIRLQKNVHELKLYNLAIHLKMTCEFLHLKKAYPGVTIPEAELKILDRPVRAVPEGHPLLSLYLELSKLIEHPEDRQFDRLEALLSEEAGNIGPKELDEILLHLFNYASHKVRLRETKEDWTRMHQLNKLALKHEVFLEKGEMPVAQFLNIVTVACKARDFDWADSFIRSSAIYLPSISRSESKLVAETIVLFEKGEHRLVVERLEGVFMRDIYLHIRSKVLLLVSFFESKADPDTMLGTCVSFEGFLRKNRKTLEGAVLATKNFVRIFKKVVHRKAEKDKLLAEIQQTKPLYLQLWLLEKLATYKPEFAAHKRRK